MKEGECEMKNQKSLTNKGFSLVELIIVVAIMAILIGVLAPQYLRYVEKSRLQKDNTSMGEIANVMKMTSSDEKMITAIGDGIKITFDTNGVMQAPALTGTAGDASVIEAELVKTLGSLGDIKLTSTTYKNGTYPTITATANSDDVIEVKTDNTWVSAPGEDPEIKKF